MDMLFLTDAKLNDFDQSVEIPVVHDWRWSVSGDGTGYLQSPNGDKFCNFNLMSGTLQLTPDVPTETIPGLNLATVQEMGEQYAQNILFDEKERADFQAELKNRQEQAKARKKEAYAAIQGNITLSYDGHGNWQTLVNTEKVKELSGIESESVLQGKEAGIDLFNQIAEAMVPNSSLKDPCGYMKAPKNLYDTIYNEYENQYDNAYNSALDKVLDATPYSLNSVLENLQKTVRSDVSKQVVPKGETYGNLRFITPTDEQKKLVKDMVRARLGLTIIYGKKRSYEDTTKEKAVKTLNDACDKLQQSIYGGESAVKTAETPMTM